MAAEFFDSLVRQAMVDDNGDPDGADPMRLMTFCAGVLVETALVFEEPDEVLYALLSNIYHAGGISPCNQEDLQFAVSAILPLPHQLDMDMEFGRFATRMFFEEWLDCAFEFKAMAIDVMRHMVVELESCGLPKSETILVLENITTRAMAFEITAQELCDLVIEHKVMTDQWNLADCVASLSAVAGHKLALSLHSDLCEVFSGPDLPLHLDSITNVMTQEAVRLGVPAGTDWRFGLAANDTPSNAPYDLIEGFEPYIDGFFATIGLTCQRHQAVACAKAAGRMLAVAAGGEVPEMEPIIAKPLAMAAMTESYKSVCLSPARAAN
jgi:hypothetical protein